MSYRCINHFDTMPDITVYMNCDTALVANLDMFDLGEQDELIFTIKNYDYIGSPYVFSFKARRGDEDENGDVFFSVPAEAAKKLKPGAFYNFAVLLEAFDRRNATRYQKLTNNGNIIIDYGAQDFTIGPDFDKDDLTSEIISVRVEPLE